MKKIIVFVYNLAKNYMMKQAKDTGNVEFEKRLADAFEAVEDAWKKINEVSK